MPAQRLSMRKVREVLRLASTGFSYRQIAEAAGLARSTVKDYLARLRAACDAVDAFASSHPLKQPGAPR